MNDSIGNYLADFLLTNRKKDEVNNGYGDFSGYWPGIRTDRNFRIIDSRRRIS